MIRKVFILIGMIIFIPLLANSYQFELENVTWIDNDLTYDQDFKTEYGGPVYIGRCYLTFKAKPTERLSAVVTLDFTKSGAAKDSYFKFAYVQYEVLPQFKVSVGLQRPMFGWARDWKFQLPAVYYSSQSAVSPPTDLGIGLSGVFGNRLEYGLQLMNGEGYKTWENSSNLNYCFISDLRYTVTESIKIGLSYKKADADADFNHAFSCYADVNIAPFRFVLDYFPTLSANSVWDHYLCAILSVPVTDRFDVTTRFDAHLQNSSTVYLGWNWDFTDYTALKMMGAVHNGSTRTYEIKTEFAFKFGLKYEN